jgi:hypothetical protein
MEMLKRSVRGTIVGREGRELSYLYGIFFGLLSDAFMPLKR